MVMIRSCLAAIALTVVSACETIQPTSLATELEDYLSNRDDFSGTVLVADADSITISVSRGLANDAQARALENDDIWRWASITKQVVAVLVIQEVERGSFSLEDTIAEIVPEFDTAFADEITVKSLLQHTSGLPNPDRLGRLVAETYKPAEFCSGAPDAEPNSQFSYNNCDYYVLGRILEASTGKSWDTLLNDRILQPLGMTETRASGSDLAQTVEGYASAGILAEPIDIALFGAAGAIYGNPRDLVKFNHGLMDGRLLSKESLEVLWDGDPSLGFAALGAWSFQASLDGCTSSMKLIERRGYIEGVQTRNFLFPETGDSVVIFINRGDFDFGEVWMQQGFSYKVLSKAICISE